MTSPFDPTPFYQPVPRQPASRSGGLLVLALLLLGGLGGWFISRAVWNHENATIGAEPRPVTPRGDLSANEKSTIQIFQQTNPSVVFINTTAEQMNWFTGDVSEVPRGTGSGFIWDKSGRIVTNFHVVQGASGARVTLWDHSSYPAKVIGVSPSNDLAVLQIDVVSAKLRPILVGSSHDLQVGQSVFAIGDPFGLDQTLTTGIVSALGRTIQSPSGHTISNVVQTDAPINPGNSGGPLLDSSGRLVGINTAIVSPSGSSAGIGFAIPVDTINRIVPQLVAHGQVVRPRLGVQTSDQLTAFVDQQLGVQGAVVLHVEPNSPAQAAGLRETRPTDSGIIPGDIIQKIGPNAVVTSEQLNSALEDYKPGDAVTLQIYRDGQTLNVDVKLEGPEK